MLHAFQVSIIISPQTTFNMQELYECITDKILLVWVVDKRLKVLTEMFSEKSSFFLSNKHPSTYTAMFHINNLDLGVLSRKEHKNNIMEIKRPRFTPTRKYQSHTDIMCTLILNEPINLQVLQRRFNEEKNKQSEANVCERIKRKCYRILCN